MSGGRWVFVGRKSSVANAFRNGGRRKTQNQQCVRLGLGLIAFMFCRWLIQKRNGLTRHVLFFSKVQELCVEHLANAPTIFQVDSECAMNAMYTDAVADTV